MSLQLDIAAEDPRWADVGFEQIALTAAHATLSRCGIDPVATEISVLACDNSKIADLNAAFREKPTPTNVLSWPEDDLAADIDGAAPQQPSPDPGGALSLGDIAIAFETCQEEALAAKIPMADHVTHLMVHGVLHLLGYDHIRDGDAALMERLETEILRTLDITDPYSVE